MLVLQAPGEAEAELASLNKLGRIDAVLMQDSDALVFGVRCILKR
jgi:Holliday junction resolvase YEN1